MRTTLDLPNDLLDQAMQITASKTKTEAITKALENIIKQEKLSRLISFRGKVNLDIDLKALRKR